MIFASARRTALAALAALGALAGCRAAAQLTAGPAPGADGSAPPSGAGVSFDATTTLTVAPLQTIAVGLTVSSGDADVAVWLEGDYLDASLDADVVTTQGQHGTVTLHTPSQPTTFGLAARINGAPVAHLDVAVSATGFATIRVVPTYTGRRSTPSFRASLFLHATCDELARGPIKDGTPVVDGTLNQPITIPSVPAGVHVTIAARVGHYAAGCTDVDALVPDAPGDGNKPQEIDVALYDVPMALGATDLAATLSFALGADDATAWGKMLAEAITRVSGGFFGGNEASALLDGARATIATSAGQAQFDAARTQQGWDAKTSTWLSSHAPSMHDRALRWLNDAPADPIGALDVRLTAAGASTGSVNVVPASWAAGAGPIAAAAVVTPGAPFDWSADATDTVHLAGSLALAPTTLVGRIADLHAASEVSGANDVASAIATQIDVGGLATALVGSGTSYAQCDAACTAGSFATAIASAWGRATSASAADTATIKLTASGVADVGDVAEPVRVAGAWLGQMTSAAGASSVRGPLAAVTYTPK